MIRRSPPKEETWANYKARFPANQVAIAKRVSDAVEAYARVNRLPWAKKLLPGWVSYKAGRENRVTIIMRVDLPIKRCIKLRDRPENLRLQNPYPALVNGWDEEHSEWMWDVPTAGLIPDLTAALDVAVRCGPQV
jgi:hypothetical protein